MTTNFDVTCIHRLCRQTTQDIYSMKNLLSQEKVNSSVKVKSWASVNRLSDNAAQGTCLFQTNSCTQATVLLNTVGIRPICIYLSHA